MEINREPLSALHILDLNDFVFLKIFSYLTEFEKFYCSKVCARFNTIALSTYSNTMSFGQALKEYFSYHNDDCEDKQKCYALVQALGKYWRHIQISYNFTILRPATILKLVKKFCPNVEHLVLQFDNIESKFVLNNLPKKLKTISLSVKCRCKGNWLTPLRYCVNIEHLTLEFNVIGNKILRGDFLTHFPNLKILIFNGCRPSSLKKCFYNSKDISILELNFDLVTSSSKLIDVISSKLTNLRRIKLQPIQSFRLDQLGLIQNLKYLTLDSYIPNDINSLLRNLITFNIVQCFELDNCQSHIYSEIISDLHKWTNLRYLHVDYMESFDDRFLRQLAECGNLNYFHFTGRSRNVSVMEMINLLIKSVNLEFFDFHIYYESSDSHTPDTSSDVKELKEFQKSFSERIKTLTIYNTPISIHCTGGFCVEKENAFERLLARSLNLDLSKGYLGL